MRGTVYDAVIVGSGPNGLAAAITLAQAGLGVLVVEGNATIGGGMRTLEVTLPGFRHDICSAIHPLGLASPFLRGFAPGRLWSGLGHPPCIAGTPARRRPRRGRHAIAGRNRRALGADGPRWRALFGPLVRQWPAVIDDLLAPFHFPRHPSLLARYAPALLSPATWLARGLFQTEAAPRRIRGHGRPLDHAAGATNYRSLWPVAHHVGAHRRLAGRALGARKRSPMR